MRGLWFRDIKMHNCREKIYFGTRFEQRESRIHMDYTFGSFHRDELEVPMRDRVLVVVVLAKILKPIPQRIRKSSRGRSARWRFRTRDDCRCNHRNSCSVDVRSDIFEEDPCPGTGKYIEAQYHCLGWFTIFYSDTSFSRNHSARNLENPFFTRLRCFMEEPHDCEIITWGTKRNFFVLRIDCERYRTHLQIMIHL